jgi:hypothetical protein
VIRAANNIAGELRPNLAFVAAMIAAAVWGVSEQRRAVPHFKVASSNQTHRRPFRTF